MADNSQDYSSAYTGPQIDNLLGRVSAAERNILALSNIASSLDSAVTDKASAAEVSALNEIIAAEVSALNETIEGKFVLLKTLIDSVFGNIEQSGTGNVVTGVEQKTGSPGTLLVRKERSAANAVDISQSDYNALANNNEIDQHTWYYIYEEQAPHRLTRIYVGDTLFADRNSSMGFAYNFPITF